jgi:hypothetical protein
MRHEQGYRSAADRMAAAEGPTERMKARCYSLYRDLVLFSLIAATGLRISEAVSRQVWFPGSPQTRQHRMH